MSVRTVLSRLERATRPADPRTTHALAQRWEALPAVVRTPAQSLGRHAVGCEGTHGVFPKCNLTCSPCYHSKDANKVRIDGNHTVTEVTRQMALFRRERGPHAHAQLIGGEVSLLSPDAHAATLLAMREHGREPMSMTHGDFDETYLRSVVLGADGRPRLARVSFAAHFDSLMRGRRGIPRPRSEAELNPYRAAFADMFRRLRRAHGVQSFLAHTMTVTTQNVDEIAQLVATVPAMGYSMMSFQPAARVGDGRRWKEGVADVGMADVWQQIEQGLGRSAPWQAVEFGDPRCNRTAFGLRVHDDWFPLLEADEAVDMTARDWFYRHLAGMDFIATPVWLVILKLLRCAVQHPSGIRVVGAYGRGLVSRLGGLRVLVNALARRRVTPLTLVVHAFMDADVVAPAWALMEEGVEAVDASVRATQERLQACMYTMAHPDTGRLIPACVQHSVLDPGENEELRRLLPLTVLRG